MNKVLNDVGLILEDGVRYYLAQETFDKIPDNTNRLLSWHRSGDVYKSKSTTALWYVYICQPGSTSRKYDSIGMPASILSEQDLVLKEINAA